MPKLQPKYDVVIVGSGLGGLLCAYMLSQEGRSVCVLEKNAQIGGNLQTFKRNRIKFDSGVHYIGGVEEGQVLHNYFKFFNLIDKLDLHKLDPNGFDRISFKGDEVAYPFGQGYEKFIEGLAHYFPEEEAGIRKYAEALQEMVSHFELYNLHRDFDEVNELDHFTVSAKKVIDNCTKNEKLRSVLAGSNMLYVGYSDRSPFYVHALILDSYIKSAYKLNFSDEIAKHLRKDLRKMGCDIFVNAEVVRFHQVDKRATSVELADGRIVAADTFVSNLHPTLTYKLMDTSAFRKANVKRILKLENTVGPFTVYIKLKPKSVPFRNYNQYHFLNDDVWDLHKYTAQDWGRGIGIFNSPDAENPEFASTLTLLSFMRFEEVEKWANTHNTTLKESERADDYQAFKKEKAKALFDIVEDIYPDLENKIEDFYTATPLTQRDYIGTADGGIYGILHDYNQPLKTLVNPQTKLTNVFLTGQNIILHGVLGVTIGSVVTCQHILGKKYLLDKIKAAVR